MNNNQLDRRSFIAGMTGLFFGSAVSSYAQENEKPAHSKAYSQEHSTTQEALERLESAVGDEKWSKIPEFYFKPTGEDRKPLLYRLWELQDLFDSEKKYSYLVLSTYEDEEFIEDSMPDSVRQGYDSFFETPLTPKQEAITQATIPWINEIKKEGFDDEDKPWVYYINNFDQAKATIRYIEDQTKDKGTETTKPTKFDNPLEIFAKMYQLTGELIDHLAK